MSNNNKQTKKISDGNTPKAINTNHTCTGTLLGLSTQRDLQTMNKNTPVCISVNLTLSDTNKLQLSGTWIQVLSYPPTLPSNSRKNIPYIGLFRANPFQKNITVFLKKHLHAFSISLQSLSKVFTIQNTSLYINKLQKPTFLYFWPPPRAIHVDLQRHKRHSDAQEFCTFSPPHATIRPATPANAWFPLPASQQTAPTNQSDKGSRHSHFYRHKTVK